MSEEEGGGGLHACDGACGGPWAAAWAQGLDRALLGIVHFYLGETVLTGKQHQQHHHQRRRRRRRQQQQPLPPAAVSSLLRTRHFFGSALIAQSGM